MSNTRKSVGGNPVSLVWLRRDLRLKDHGAFAHAGKFEEAVQPLFVFDTDVLARFTAKADRRLTFIVRALIALHRQLAEKNGGLLVSHGKAETLLPRICHALRPARLIAAGDVEPATRARDEHVKEALDGKTDFILVKDHVIQSAHEVLKADGTPYKIFTPYAKAWRARVATSGCFEERKTDSLKFADFEQQKSQLAGLNYIDLAQGENAVLQALGYELAESEWHPQDARASLAGFIQSKMQSYKVDRDFMGMHGTSRLSPYLRFGILSARECARASAEQEAQGMTGASTWTDELIWRDFYAMILAHFPRTAQEEFQRQYIGIAWRRDQADFRRFAQGQTGYPIIDAAMRELLETGVMHNRARMIVASFMTKDLLLDWRMGEEHFAQLLMDYDLASNVGGWQWAASTGTDAQPYFRIFNPILQSRKFDPEGHYIRRFVPELAHLSARDIHEPWKLSQGAANPKGYPAPMVDHANIKERVLTLFKSYRL